MDTAIGVLVGAGLLLLEALSALLFGWLFMLAVGVVHHEWWPAVPTIGYWWAVLFTALMRAVFFYARYHLHDER